MIASFSTFPLDKGEGVSKEVAEIIELIDKSGLDYQLNAMSTVVEGDSDEVFALIKACHQKLREKSHRVYTIITIDDREGAKGRLTGKKESVERILGHKVR